MVFVLHKIPKKSYKKNMSKEAVDVLIMAQICRKVQATPELHRALYFSFNENTFSDLKKSEKKYTHRHMFVVYLYKIL